VPPHGESGLGPGSATVADAKLAARSCLAPNPPRRHGLNVPERHTVDQPEKRTAGCKPSHVARGGGRVATFCAQRSVGIAPWAMQDRGCAVNFHPRSNLRALATAVRF